MSRSISTTPRGSCAAVVHPRRLSEFSSNRPSVAAEDRPGPPMRRRGPGQLLQCARVESQHFPESHVWTIRNPQRRRPGRLAACLRRERAATAAYLVTHANAKNAAMPTAIKIQDHTPTPLPLVAAADWSNGGPGRCHEPPRRLSPSILSRREKYTKLAPWTATPIAVMATAGHRSRRRLSRRLGCTRATYKFRGTESPDTALVSEEA
jgi:hypothetical protein